MNQKFEMCVKKLEHELESQEDQNEFVRDWIREIKKDMKGMKDMKETKADILLFKGCILKQKFKRVRSRKAINLEARDRRNIGFSRSD